ncbi:MAG TPA: hypothetical protein VND87_02035 [Stellaceae bacterium]|nr:hypothetical protein [Stellaceae bacterium]
MYPILISPRGAVATLGTPGRLGGALRRLRTWLAARVAAVVEQRDKELTREYFRFPPF